MAIIYWKFLIKRFGEFDYSSRDGQSATWLTASWFVGELSAYPARHGSKLHDHGHTGRICHTVRLFTPSNFKKINSANFGPLTRNAHAVHDSDAPLMAHAVHFSGGHFEGERVETPFPLLKC